MILSKSTRKDIYERGLPGPVFANKAVDFAFPDAEGHLIQGDNAGEMLAYFIELYQRSHERISSPATRRRFGIEYAWDRVFLSQAKSIL
jgi:hypothetical protein